MRTICIALLLTVLAALPGRAELSVSVTLSGDLDEILTVLTQLQALGIGGAATADDSLSVEVHSSMDGAAGGAEPLAVEAEAPKPAPRLAFSNPVLPAQATPGADAALTIQVIDDDHIVDTIAAHIAETALAVDLFDNGTHGDHTAGDGIWSGLIHLPTDLAPGEYSIVFSAYDAMGNAVPLLTEDGHLVPLTATAKLRVTAP